MDSDSAQFRSPTTPCHAQAEEKRKTEEVARADRVLLETFGSEDDLILARDGKLSAIDGQIRLLESHIHKSEADLERRMVLVKSIEQRGQRPAEQILADIEYTRAQIAATNVSAASCPQGRARHARSQGWRDLT